MDREFDVLSFDLGQLGFNEVFLFVLRDVHERCPFGDGHFLLAAFRTYR